MKKSTFALDFFLIRYTYSGMYEQNAVFYRLIFLYFLGFIKLLLQLTPAFLRNTKGSS